VPHHSPVPASPLCGKVQTHSHGINYTISDLINWA
jgi:hypothetical protein